MCICKANTDIWRIYEQQLLPLLSQLMIKSPNIKRVQETKKKKKKVEVTTVEARFLKHAVIKSEE